MEPIKIAGEWRQGGKLEPGRYLWRHPGSDRIGGVACLTAEGDFRGFPIQEYLGPLEIVEPEPELTPMPGCWCETGVITGGRYYARSVSHNDASSLEVIAYGTIKRQAILRHNAAVAAIVAMEGK